VVRGGVVVRVCARICVFVLALVWLLCMCTRVCVCAWDCDLLHWSVPLPRD
jgi:hypothetical protein